MKDKIKYITFSPDLQTADTALLIKDSAFFKSAITQYYLRPPIDQSRIIAMNLFYEPGNKISSAVMKEYMDVLLPELSALGIKSVYVADSKYYQYLTKQTITESVGTVVKCKIKDYMHLDIIAGINSQSLFHNPSNASLLDISVNTLLQHLDGYDVKATKDIIKDATYLDYSQTTTTMVSHLNDLSKHSILSADIETGGHEDGDALRFNKSSLASIAFGSSIDSGTAIYLQDNKDAKKLLKQFFINYSGKVVYHNGLFDIKHLIYHLFMETPDDIIGMLYGIEVMCKSIDDTMVMTYLCTNNVQENKLGLKHNALPYTGQYAVEVKDVYSLPTPKLLEYNLKDALATFWLYLQQAERIVTEEQVEVYETIFLPAFKVLLETMLIGLPLDMNQVSIVKSKLQSEAMIAANNLEKSPIIEDLMHGVRTVVMDKANAKLKKKVKPISDFDDINFNPNSGIHKRMLLYEVLKFPVIDLTKTKLPAVGGKTIKKLKNHTTDPDVLDLLSNLQAYSDASKILTTFIKAFENFAFTREDGTVWLNGDQILCGTVSGRLGSKNPNLANLPSGSTYGKLVKSCFKAPEGWLFCGADFSALN